MKAVSASYFIFIKLNYYCLMYQKACSKVLYFQILLSPLWWCFVVVFFSLLIFGCWLVLVFFLVVFFSMLESNMYPKVLRFGVVALAALELFAL